MMSAFRQESLRKIFHAFSAGYALRDYDLLLEAAPLISAPIWIGTHPALLGHRAAGMPSNVTVSHVPRGEFLERLRRASAVVVPLERRQDRSAGQTTYLTAMALGKIVVVTDSIGVSDHIEDGRTGFIVPPGDSRALAAAITAVLDPAENERMTAVATAAARGSPRRSTWTGCCGSSRPPPANGQALTRSGRVASWVGATVSRVPNTSS